MDYYTPRRLVHVAPGPKLKNILTVLLLSHLHVCACARVRVCVCVSVCVCVCVRLCTSKGTRALTLRIPPPYSTFSLPLPPSSLSPLPSLFPTPSSVPAPPLPSPLPPPPSSPHPSQTKHRAGWRQWRDLGVWRLAMTSGRQKTASSLRPKRRARLTSRLSIR